MYSNSEAGVSLIDESQLLQLFMEVPAAISVYTGRDMVITMSNAAAYRLSGRSPDILGSKLEDVFPEIKTQGFLDLLHRVYDTGETYRASEAPVKLMVGETEKLLYVNFTYQPLAGSDGKTKGILTFAVDVTEQVEARKKIEESQNRFRNVLQQAPYPILILRGTDLRLDAANPSLLKLWNIGEDSIGKKFLDILPEMKEQGFYDLLMDVYNTGATQYGFESPAYFVRDGEKKLHYFNFVYHPYREHDQSISGVLIIATDVTGQVLARQQAARSDERFRSMILQAPIGICIIKVPDYEIEIVNKKYASLMDKTPEQLTGMPLMEVIRPAIEYRPVLEEVRRSGKPFYGYEHLVSVGEPGNQKALYADFVIEPLFEENGQLERIMFLVIDVTEKLEARQKMLLTEARAQSAIDSAELGSFDLDMITDEVFTSRRLDEIFEVEHTTDRSRYVSAIHPDDLAIRDEAQRRALESGDLEYEVRLIRKNQEMKWIRVKGGVLFSENRKPLRMHGVVQDITEHKRFEEELSRQVAVRTKELTEINLQLQRTNAELDQFAYVATHDLQEPLRKIVTFTNMIKERYEVTDEVMKYIKKTSDAADRMNGLIRNLLDYSRLSSAVVNYEKVDLNVILENVLVDYELLIEQKKATVKKGLLEKVEAIPLQMNQLFYNLLGNALKFSQKNVSPVIEITGSPLKKQEQAKFAELHPDQSYYKIRFADNGIGFNQDYANKIFVIFQRLNERSLFGGYGIGLALCKKIAENHRGLIYAEGELKKGAIFTIILPYHQP